MRPPLLPIADTTDRNQHEEKRAQRALSLPGGSGGAGSGSPAYPGTSPNSPLSHASRAVTISSCVRPTKFHHITSFSLQRHPADDEEPARAGGRQRDRRDAGGQVREHARRRSAPARPPRRGRRRWPARPPRCTPYSNPSVAGRVTWPARGQRHLEPDQRRVDLGGGALAAVLARHDGDPGAVGGGEHRQVGVVGEAAGRRACAPRAARSTAGCRAAAAGRCARRLLRVRDGPARRHQVELARPDQLLGAEAVAVQHQARRTASSRSAGRCAGAAAPACPGPGGHVVGPVVVEEAPGPDGPQRPAAAAAAAPRCRRPMAALRASTTSTACTHAGPQLHLVRPRLEVAHEPHATSGRRAPQPVAPAVG